MEQAMLFDAADTVLGDLEAWCRAEEIWPVIGVDEAGRGPLAGPVYAAAVALDLRSTDDGWFELLDDSKKLTAQAREEAAIEIKERALAWSVAWSDVDVIDDINILQATLRAMEQAIEDVAAQLDEPVRKVFIDGNQRVVTTIPQQTVIKGDGRSYHIAAASILAKTERDHLMIAAHERWPEYAFESNKGYGTVAHREAIEAHGPCPLHRASFAGVREHLDRLRAD